MTEFVTDADLTARLAQFKKDLEKEAETAAKESKDSFETYMNDRLGADVAAADQAVYASNQIIKWDPSMLSISPEMITWDARGLHFMGVEIFRNPWVNAIERDGGYETRREEREGSAVTRLADRVGEQDARIRTLAEGQRALAGRAASQVEPERQRQERRRQTSRLTGRPTDASRRAAELRGLEQSLRRVEERADGVARAFAG
ncbi:hypothetical protein [Streptomyces sp. NPDC047928]|uniref:hypothetical protein n=1 Tax=unclassified Streptomyces TaxID=2593676 RepID=UPI003715C349